MIGQRSYHESFTLPYAITLPLYDGPYFNPDMGSISTALLKENPRICKNLKDSKIFLKLFSYLFQYNQYIYIIYN